MRPVARTIHAVLAWLFVAVLIVQVWLAGRAVFESPGLFATHRDVGYTLSIFPSCCSCSASWGAWVVASRSWPRRSSGF